MKKQTILAFALVLTINLFAQEDREKFYSEELQGTITALDTESREVTLVGQEGNIVTLIAGDEVERFNELEIGDLIKLEYWIYMMAEFRNPTKEELAEPLVIIAEAGKVDLDLPPGAAIGALVKAVVTVEVINRPFMDVVVQGPQGNFMTIPVDDPSLIEMLNVGKVVILTYAEAMALYIEKI
jgi:hypothetical protein